MYLPVSPFKPPSHSLIPLRKSVAVLLLTDDTFYIRYLLKYLEASHSTLKYSSLFENNTSSESFSSSQAYSSHANVAFLKPVLSEELSRFDGVEEKERMEEGKMKEGRMEEGKIKEGRTEKKKRGR